MPLLDACRRRSLPIGAALLLAGCSMNGGGDGGPPDLVPPPPAQLRVAHYTSGGVPAVDVCVKGDSDPDFVGPLVKQKAGSPGVTYPNVSAYMELAPQSYTVRAIKATATTCATAFAGVMDITIPALTGGHHYTIAAVGYLNQPITIKFVILEDDVSTQQGQARLRFLHAAAGRSAIELGSGAAGSYSRLFLADTYAALAQSGNGYYLTTAPVTSATYSLRDGGAGTDLVSFTNKLTFAADRVYSVAAIGFQGNSFSPLALSVCDDLAAPMNGLSSCQEIR